MTTDTDQPISNLRLAIEESEKISKKRTGLMESLEDLSQKVNEIHPENVTMQQLLILRKAFNRAVELALTSMEECQRSDAIRVELFREEIAKLEAEMT